VGRTGCATVKGATLRLTDNADGSVKGGDIDRTTTAWTDAGVTWSNAPGKAALLGSLGAISSGATYTVDVTGGVTTLNGEVDFRISTTSSDGTHYYSKEGGAAARFRSRR